MMDKKSLRAPNSTWSILTMKCPRCRYGDMFIHKSAYRHLSLKNIFAMPEHCAECGQKFDIEPGFWYGTGYVSYAITVAISVATFIAWWVLIGISIKDNRVFWWLGINALLLVVLQPWIMRLSRVIYMRFFVSFDPDYKQTLPKQLD